MLAGVALYISNAAMCCFFLQNIPLIQNLQHISVADGVLAALGLVLLLWLRAGSFLNLPPQNLFRELNSTCLKKRTKLKRRD